MKNTEVSDQEMNDFFVKRFKENNFISINGLERFRKKDKIRIFSYVEERITEHLKDGNWEGLEYLHLPTNKKEEPQEMVYFSLVKGVSNVPDGVYCYKEITKKKFYKAMDKMITKQAKQINKLKKSGLPF
jgi:CO dehydrogenase/acetyl-CoA synthase epsilon subunit